MKRLMILALLILGGLVAYGQWTADTVDFGSAANDGTGTTLRAGAQYINDMVLELRDSSDVQRTDLEVLADTNTAQTVILNTHESRLDGHDTRLDSTVGSQLGWFDVRDYGTGAQAWQTAIDSANAQTRGGIVYAPAGTYTFDSDTVVMKSNVTILMHDWAMIYVPLAHTNTCIFYSENNLERFRISGGRFFSGAYDTDFFKFNYDGGGYAQNCIFEYLNCYGADNMFNIYTDDGGYFNGNTINDTWCEASRSFMKTRDPNETGGGIAANFISNITIQANDSSETVLDSLCGGRNQFVNFMVWDWGGDNSGKTVVLTSTSNNNILIGDFVTDSTVDNGDNNTIIDVMGDFVFGNGIKVNDNIEVGDYGSTPYYVVKENLTFSVEGETADTIIVIPIGTTVWDIKAQVNTAFNDSGYDYLKIGRTDSQSYFYDNLDISSTGFKDLSGAITNVPEEFGSARTLTMRYYGENNNATGGSVDVWIFYSMD